MKNAVEPSSIKWIYGLAALLAIFTGFGNMPLYGRYYIADLPGFHWTGNFIANVKVHYLFGAVLLALGIYYLLLYLLVRNRGLRFTKMGLAQAGALMLVLLSGLIMAVKNFPGVIFDLPLQIGMNFFHLGSAMLFVLVTFGGLIFRRRWFRASALRQMAGPQ